MLTIFVANEGTGPFGQRVSESLADVRNPRGGGLIQSRGVATGPDVPIEAEATPAWEG